MDGFIPDKNSVMSDKKEKKLYRQKKIIRGVAVFLCILPAVLNLISASESCLLKKETDNISDGKGNNYDTSEVYEEKDSEACVYHTEDTSALMVYSEPDNGQTEEVKSTEKKRYAYLTFDDGPSNNTYRIMDTLESYGVKGTFFVIGKTEEEYEQIYRDIVKRGHAIGIHSFTHRYKSLYSGVEGFAGEVTMMHDYLYNITGKDIHLFRFPGGSSNSIVDDIKPYIQWLEDNGYVYYDWNSSGKDAMAGTPSSEEIIKTVMSESEGVENLVILMHDGSTKNTTVEALPGLIENLRSKGYEIKAIDEQSKPVQHRTLN